MQFKVYGIIATIVIASLALSYHIARVSKLERTIASLEMEHLKSQQRVVNCKQNLIQIESMLDKQNSALESIKNTHNKRLEDLKFWSSKSEEEKYSQKVNNVFKSSTLEDLINNINNLDYNKDL